MLSPAAKRRVALKLKQTIEPGSPWENGSCESFTSRMSDEFLHAEIFETWYEVEALTKEWIHHYNFKRPHSSRNYRPPAVQAKAAYVVVGLTLKVDLKMGAGQGLQSVVSMFQKMLKF